MTYHFFLITLCISILCAEKNKDQTVSLDKPVISKPHVIAPDFNADSAFHYIKTQADFGPRVPGSPAHEQAVTYYESQFKRFGAEVIIQKGSVTTYDHKTWELKNVIASFNPKVEERILLCAHWDSRPFSDKEETPENKLKPCPGVNDGASGVGVLIELARQIARQKPTLGIDIILFDLEDYGDNEGNPDTWCLGSQYWGRNLHVPYYGARFGILLDMVGAKDAIFPKEGLSKQYAGEYINLIWGTAQRLGYSNYFINQDCAEMTDDHAPVNRMAQIPCVDILHYDMTKNEFFKQHHRTTDDISTIDKHTLKSVGQTVLEVIYNQY